MKLIFSLFCLCLIIPANLASAQFTIETSSAEDAAIAFYKTGATIPDFEPWIKNRTPYKETPWAMRDKKYEDELARLTELYQDFKPAEDFLKIRSKIKIDFENFEMIDPETGADVKHIIMKSIFFDKEETDIYFPYKFLDEYIALIPDNIGRFTSTIVTNEEFDFISKNISSRPTVYIEMIPFKANTEHPAERDGQEQWELHAKVVSFLIINDKGSVIWEKTAPWYVSPQTRTLNELYEGQYR